MAMSVMQIIRKAVGRIQARSLPWLLLLCAVTLTLVGALFISSVWGVRFAGLLSWPPSYPLKHLIFGALGVIAFFCVAFFDYRHFSQFALPLYAAGLVSLALLPVLGVRIHEARRWYDLGLFRVQPSEPMKYMVVIALADYFCYRQGVRRLRDLAFPLALTLAPMALISRQPDLGSAMLFVPVFFGVAFLAGVPVRNLAVVILAGVLLLAAAWSLPERYGVKDYQKQRVYSFLDPEGHPESPASYNARQVTLALTGGGPWGHGWGRGELNRLGRIPERHTDFIFPVIAEEWGFFRTAGVVLAYLLLMCLLARIVWGTRDAFGRLLAGGVLVVFAVQSLLHMAISLRLAPITGLTLPLVSYGGSSLVSTYAGLGLAASVSMRRTFVFSPEERD